MRNRNLPADDPNATYTVNKELELWFFFNFTTIRSRNTNTYRDAEITLKTSSFFPNKEHSPMGLCLCPNGAKKSSFCIASYLWMKN